MTARWRVAATRQVRESAETGVHVEGARAEVVSRYFTNSLCTCTYHTFSDFYIQVFGQLVLIFLF